MICLTTQQARCMLAPVGISGNPSWQTWNRAQSEWLTEIKLHDQVSFVSRRVGNVEMLERNSVIIPQKSERLFRYSAEYIVFLDI